MRMRSACTSVIPLAHHAFEEHVVDIVVQVNKQEGTCVCFFTCWLNRLELHSVELILGSLLTEGASW